MGAFRRWRDHCLHFDRPAEEHMRVAALALEKAKSWSKYPRMYFCCLIDNKACKGINLIVSSFGKDTFRRYGSSCSLFPKKFFGAARNIEFGGSLTIIGTALVNRSRMDDVIYEEFKGTGNMEVHLSRKISEQRIFPALDITKSGTRKEELLVLKMTPAHLGAEKENN